MNKLFPIVLALMFFGCDEVKKISDTIVEVYGNGIDTFSSNSLCSEIEKRNIDIKNLEFNEIVYGSENQSMVLYQLSKYEDLINLTSEIPDISLRYLKKENIKKFNHLASFHNLGIYKFIYIDPEFYISSDILKDGDKLIFLAYKNSPNLKSKNILDAKVEADISLRENYNIILELDQISSSSFADYTSRSIGKAIAISLDGEVLSAPIIQSRISGGNIQISGFDSYNKAENIVLSILASKINCAK